MLTGRPQGADAFQGCYKNGTNGTRDYRYFAGLYLLFRIILLTEFITRFSYMWLIPFPVVVSLLFAYFRPYKNNLFNIIDCLAFALVALTTYLLVFAIRIRPFSIQLLYVIGSIPFLYFITLILYKILSRVALFRTCCSRLRKKIQARKENQDLDIDRDENINDDLPDRIVNPDMYQPLLAVTDDGEGNS